MVPAPNLCYDRSPPSPTRDDTALETTSRKPTDFLDQDIVDDDAALSALSAAERATLAALTTTLRVCNAHLGGSAIGKGFRRAARYHLRERAPRGLPSLGAAADAQPVWDTAALEPGVRPVIEDPFYVVDLGVVAAQLARWRAAFPRVVPYYAVKCNPDPAIVRTLMSLGCNFDCASKAEITLVQGLAAALAPAGLAAPDIVYANPTKARAHVIDAVCRGVRRMTFDNVAEVRKCAAVSKQIQLILRIITDDSGSQCRLSSKFGAPPSHWPTLLGEAKRCGLEVVGVSFHVGSGCRDASRYAMALQDCKRLFEMAERDFGFKMTILDIGGGFPGETHSMWNPVKAFGDITYERGPLKKPASLVNIPSISEGDEAVIEDKEEEDLDDGGLEGKEPEEERPVEDKERQYMYFDEIAEAVAPMLDELFPPSTGVKIIAEPGRYLVAAAATVVASIVSVRGNSTSDNLPTQAISDRGAADNVFRVSRAEEDEIVQGHARALEQEENPIIGTLVEELADYSQRFARANLSQQEVDVYLDNIEAGNTDERMAKAPAMEPGRPCTKDGTALTHTVEGMQAGIVVGCADLFDDDASAISGLRSKVVSAGAEDLSVGERTKHADLGLDIPCVLAAAGEAAVSGIVRQAIADTTQPLQDEFAYYINDGVYGAFNNLLFDHATVRPRRLRDALGPTPGADGAGRSGDGALRTLTGGEEEGGGPAPDDALYPSTVFGPTCDSMDVLSRGVLLPKMDVGDWMYFQNMGAYTSAAASSFNGFPATESFYVCSVPPQHFPKLVMEGRVGADSVVHADMEEKKDAA